jgi:hypothetical protein
MNNQTNIRQIPVSHRNLQNSSSFKGKNWKATDERARQLTDIANENGDAAECAAADLAREFPAQSK